MSGAARPPYTSEEADFIRRSAAMFWSRRRHLLSLKRRPPQIFVHRRAESNRAKKDKSRTQRCIHSYFTPWRLVALGLRSRDVYRPSNNGRFSPSHLQFLFGRLGARR
jgi:hypothetical protein